MSIKEWRRLQVLSQVKAGKMVLREAAIALQISYRQVRRLHRRHLADQDKGLVHGLRGRSSNRLLSPATRQAVLKLCRDRYAGFGPPLACEHLEKDGHVVSHDTLGRWLREEGLFERRRRRSKHRSWRQRRSSFGELLQMDGSPHDWFEGRRIACCLMVMVDDATGRVFARFYEKESTESSFDIFGRYIARYGLPLALYVDRAGIYRAEDQEGDAVETQFGRASRELGVELILANSPQAKGRVERQNQTLQDRLVKEMGLLKLSSIEQGNAFLEGGFLEELNERFAIEATCGADVHRSAPPELAWVLCQAEARVVGEDWCIRWKGGWLQIQKEHEALGLAGRSVEVRQKADRSMRILWRGETLKFEAVQTPAKKPRAHKVVVNNKVWKPGANHPWNRPFSAASPAPAAPTRDLRQKPEQRTVLLR
jgi:hypothetical protein